MPRRSLKMPDDLHADLAYRYILYRMVEEKEKIPATADGDYQFLEDLLADKFDEYWTIEEGKDHYTPTRKGELIYHNFIARWWDFIVTYDIFAGVDLQEGVFAEDDADWDAVDERGQPIWEDLRVAVCIYKQRLAQQSGQQTALNPFAIAFMSLLSERRIGRSFAWPYDLASREFWKEVEEIVNTNLWPEDLGYEDEETGKQIPGDEVMRDVIEQGIEQTKMRWDEEDDEESDEFLAPPEGLTTRGEVVEEYEEVVTDYGWGYDPFYYDPYAVVAGGLLTAAFVGAVWCIL